MQGITIKEDIGNIAGVKWLRSQLSSLPLHHMAYKCTVKRYGTVLYRHIGDLVHALNVSLGQVRTQTNTGTDCKSDTEDNFDSNLTQTCLTLNAKCHTYIQTLLREDALSPHNIEDVDIESTISRSIQTYGKHCVYLHSPSLLMLSKRLIPQVLVL